MPKRLWPIILFVLWTGLAQAMLSPSEITAISQAIVDRIITGEPIILDIRAGEWSQTLTSETKRLLLQKDADIREVSPAAHSPAFPISDAEDDAPEEYDLGRLNLKSAILVLVEMELRWQTVERKRFLSYSSQRKPLYVFNIKQIALPSQKLRQIDAFDWELKTTERNNNATTSIKWYEPLLVTAALASIIYLLWTTE